MTASEPTPAFSAEDFKAMAAKLYDKMDVADANEVFEYFVAAAAQARELADLKAKAITREELVRIVFDNTPLTKGLPWNDRGPGDTLYDGALQVVSAILNIGAVMVKK